MFCKYCGKQLDDNAKFCPECGAKIIEENAPKPETDDFFKDAPLPAETKAPTAPAPHSSSDDPFEKMNILALVGLYLAFACPIAGLICSIIGFNQCSQTKEGGKGFALAGIIVSAVFIVLSIVAVSAILSLFFNFPNFLNFLTNIFSRYE